VWSVAFTSIISVAWKNFALPVSGLSSVLLIGKNGVGKTTVGRALEILQKIARGKNRVGELVKRQDLTRGREGNPIRFEIEVELEKKVYGYTIAFELPQDFKEFRVLDEKLTVGGSPIYTRAAAKVHLAASGPEKEADFGVDWHLVALPIIQRKSKDDLLVFKQWLAQMLVLRPVP
jgi:ABC-type branched-subunit amino acid transport system ATPase component